MKQMRRLLPILVFLAAGSAFGPVPFADAEGETLPPITVDPRTAELLETGRWEAALDALKPLYERHDADPDLGKYVALCHRKIGEAALSGNRFAEAVTHLETALALTPRDPPTLILLARTCLRLADYVGAENHLLDAVAIEPENAAAHKLLGETYYLTNRLADARYHWSRAVSLSPGDRAVKARLGNLQRQLRESRSFDTEADHIFSVRFDGVRNPHLKDRVLDILQEAHFRIGQRLNLWPNRQIPVILLTREAFSEITGSPGWAGGVYEGHIKIPVAGIGSESLRTVLFHEYVHAAVHDTLSDRCPWWLNEGLAQFFSEDPSTSAKLTLASEVLAASEPPALGSLPDPFISDRGGPIKAYALALSATRFLLERFGTGSVTTFLELLAEGLDPSAAMADAVGYTLEEFEREWTTMDRMSPR